VRGLVVPLVRGIARVNDWERTGQVGGLTAARSRACRHPRDACLGGAPGAQDAAVDPNRLLVVVGFGDRTRELRRHRRMGSGAVDELLGVAVERPALEQLEVEVARAPKDRAGPGPS